MIMTIEFQAIEFPTAGEAIQWTEAGECGKAVRLNGRFYAIEPVEAHCLEAAGVEFAYLHVHEMARGELRIVTVPVN